jgi:hypothetical protein
VKRIFRSITSASSFVLEQILFIDMVITIVISEAFVLNIYLFLVGVKYLASINVFGIVSEVFR